MPTDVESELVASLVRIGEGQTGSHEWATIVSLEDAGWGPHWVQPASWAPTSKIIKIMHSALGTRAHVPVCARVLAGRGIHLSEEEICSYTKQLKKKKPLLGPARDYGNGHMRSTSRLALLAVPASRLLLEEGDELGAQVAAAQDALLAAGAPPPPPPPSSEKVALADAEARARAAEKALAVERARARKAERAAERREKELQQELRDVREAAQEQAQAAAAAAAKERQQLLSKAAAAADALKAERKAHSMEVATLKSKAAEDILFAEQTAVAIERSAAVEAEREREAQRLEREAVEAEVPSPPLP